MAPPAPSMAMSGTVIVGPSNMFMHAPTGRTWSSSNPARATVGATSGIVTDISLSTARISYTIPGAGCPATRGITVVPAPSTNPGEGEGSIRILPNPNRGVHDHGHDGYEDRPHAGWQTTGRRSMERSDRHAGQDFVLQTGRNVVTIVELGVQ